MLRLVVKESVKQAPALVVLAAVVWMFLGALQQNNQFIAGLADACHVTHRLSSEVIQANTMQMGRVERIIDQSIKVLARCNGG